VKEDHDEDGRDLRPGVLGPAEGDNTIAATAALKEFAAAPGRVPEDGFEVRANSGALVAPGLERSATWPPGAIPAVLVHAPDREPQVCLSVLSRGIRRQGGSRIRQGAAVGHAGGPALCSSRG